MNQRIRLSLKRMAFLAVVMALVLNCSFLKGKVHAEKDYSNVDVEELQEIKNDPKALAQVRNVSAVSYEKEEAGKIKEQMMLVSSCPNLEYLYICVNGLYLDKEFFNDLPGTYPKIVISLQWGSVDFQGIDNSSVKEIFLSQNTITHFEDIVGFHNLESLNTDCSDGVCIADFDKLEHLERLSFSAQRIDDYKKFFEKIRNVNMLGLLNCNLQDKDLMYLKDLPNLTSLQIAGTFVQDASALRDCKKLTFLGLPYGLSDLSFLYDLPNLSSVEFDAYTELHVDEALVKHFEENDVWFPDFDRDISKKVQKIVDSLGITESMTDREKTEKVTEYVLLNMVGDEEELNENLLAMKGGTGTTLSYDVNVGAGLCHWYAVLEYTLLKYVGIDAYYVEGYALFSEEDTPGAHAWNEVCIDGEWYGIDPLWLDDDNNDPTTPDYKDFAWRLYFLKPTKTDNYHDYPQYGNEEEYMDKYFALEHRTMNDPGDTFAAGGTKKETAEDGKPEESKPEESKPEETESEDVKPDVEPGSEETSVATEEEPELGGTEDENHLTLIIVIVAVGVVLLITFGILVAKKKGTKKES